MGQKTYYEPDRGEQPARRQQLSRKAIETRTRELQRATPSGKRHRGRSDMPPELTKQEKQAIREKEESDDEYLTRESRRNRILRSYRPISRGEGNVSDLFFHLWFDNYDDLTKEMQETLDSVAPLVAGTVLYELDQVWTREEKETEKARAQLARGDANSILRTDKLSCLVRNHIATPNDYYSAAKRNHLNQYLRSAIGGGVGRGKRTNSESESGRQLWSEFRMALGAGTVGSAQYDCSAPTAAEDFQAECYTYAQTAPFNTYGPRWQTGSLSRNSPSW